MSEEYRKSDEQVLEEALEEAVRTLQNRGASDAEIWVALKPAYRRVISKLRSIRLAESLDENPFWR